ncbi:hypothetical protein ONZ45_g2294 [Pleurotus djamor]|nr:hypothetical protein ONZ45_g2294 [Pleurotus djamor]
MKFVPQRSSDSTSTGKVPKSTPMQVACSSWASVPSELEKTMVKIFGDAMVSLWFSMIRKERCFVPEYPPVEVFPPKPPTPSLRKRAKALFTKPSHLSNVLANDSTYLVLQGSKKVKTPSIVVRQPTGHGISDDLQLDLADIEGTWESGIPVKTSMEPTFPQQNCDILMAHMLNPTYGYPVRVIVEHTLGHTSLRGIPKMKPKGESKGRAEKKTSRVQEIGGRNLDGMGPIERFMAIRAMEVEKERERAQLAEAPKGEEVVVVSRRRGGIVETAILQKKMDTESKRKATKKGPTVAA